MSVISEFCLHAFMIDFDCDCVDDALFPVLFCARLIFQKCWGCGVAARLIVVTSESRFGCSHLLLKLLSNFFVFFFDPAFFLLNAHSLINRIQKLSNDAKALFDERCQHGLPFPTLPLRNKGIRCVIIQWPDAGSALHFSSCRLQRKNLCK